MKWLALALIIAGIASIVAAFRSDSASSFEDGSFLGEIGLFVLGACLGLSGLVMFAVLLFRSL